MATAKQLAADRANLAKARAALKGKPRTAKQIAASKANLAKANAKRKATKKATSAPSRGALKITGSRVTVGRHSTKHLRRTPLGSHRSGVNLHAEPLKHHITGVNKKFVKRMAPTSFGTRGSWKSSRAHHFKKRLHIRKTKTIHVKTWHHRKHRQTPR